MGSLDEAANSSIRFQSRVINDTRLQTIALVNFILSCGVVCLFGPVANVINIIAFYKQGLDTTINISFFSLAVSDLCCLIFQQLYNVFVNPLFLALKLPIVYTDVQFLTTSVNREMFARITCLITAFITAERCLCVVFPLKIKQMITPRITACVIIIIFVFTLLSPVPMYCTAYFATKFYPDLNRTLLGLAFTKHNYATQAFVYFTHALFTTLGFLSVLTFTLILIYKLGQKSAWRQTANADQEKAKSMSKRDRATITMVVLIASILVVCYTPAVVLSLTTFFVPEFSPSGAYYAICYICWMLAVLFENINSSVNIFLYYKMSSKYRKTFKELFPVCFPVDQRTSG